MNENLCARCKTPNRNNAKYCAGCGAPLLEKADSKKEPPPILLDETGSDTGTVLQGRYRLIKELGRGGFGAVYRAWDANLNKACAIKENLESSPAAYRQFVREASVLANLSHPNLPRVTDHFFIQDKGQYLVMDFVEGEDLVSLLKRQKTIPVEQAQDWISQVAEALVYLHNRKPPVIHRDIKPSNIRITPDGRAMLVDFGLVKVFDPHMKTTLGARAVTPGFAPPEQYGHGKTDIRTDIYALGATLYNLVTAQDPLESVQRIAGTKMPSVNQLNPLVPLRLSQVIERAMALEPSQRYQTAFEFLVALKSGTVSSVSSGYPKEKVLNQLERTDRKVKPFQSPAVSPAVQVPGTQAVQTMPEFELQIQDTHKPVSRRTIGIVVLVAILLCFGAAASLVGWVNHQQQQNDQATQDAHSLETQERQTSTAEAKATATSKFVTTSTARAIEFIRATSTAEGIALQTAQAREIRVAEVIANRTLVYGPTSGYLAHNTKDEKIDYFSSAQNLSNFIVEVRFSSPYPLSEGDWDFGIVFRTSTSGQFRLVVISDSSWKLSSIEEEVDVPAIAVGTLTNLDVNEGGSNWIRIICQGDWGVFYVNGAIIDEWDLSDQLDPGNIWVATGMMKGNVIDGKSTYYQDFTIWSIP